MRSLACVTVASANQFIWHLQRGTEGYSVTSLFGSEIGKMFPWYNLMGTRQGQISKIYTTKKYIYIHTIKPVICQ